MTISAASYAWLYHMTSSLLTLIIYMQCKLDSTHHFFKRYWYVTTALESLQFCKPYPHLIKWQEEKHNGMLKHFKRSNICKSVLFEDPTFAYITCIFCSMEVRIGIIVFSQFYWEESQFYWEEKRNNAKTLLHKTTTYQYVAFSSVYFIIRR